MNRPHPLVTDDHLREVPAVEAAGTAPGEAAVAGTAIVLTPNVVLTCRHVLGAGDALLINGRVASHEVIASGRGDGVFEGDWCLVRLGAPLRSRGPTIDADRVVEPGDPLFLVGWTDREGTLERAFTVVETHAARRPSSFELDGDHFLFAAAPLDVDFGGLSGGPVGVWDEASASLVVVGMALGRWGEKGPFIGERKRFVIQRLSEPALAEAVGGALAGSGVPAGGGTEQ